MPAAETVIERVVAPFDHKYPFAAEDVNVKVVPGQTFNELLAETVGVVGLLLAFTAVTADVPPQPPELVVTE